jgi:hypothetical protein
MAKPTTRRLSSMTILAGVGVDVGGPTARISDWQ